MTVAKEYKVRPSPHNHLQETVRVFLARAFFELHGIKTGEICNLRTSEGFVGEVVAWASTEKITTDVVQMSTSLQKAYSLSLETRVYISPSNNTIAPANDVTLREITSNGSDISLDIEDKVERARWTGQLESILRSTHLLTTGLTIENVLSKGRKKSFQIESINFSNTARLFRFQADTEVLIANSTYENQYIQPPCISGDGLGGLSKQIERINNAICTRNLLTQSLESYPGPSCGSHVLIHGLHGTGKTLVLSKVSEASWREVFRIDNKSTEADIVRIFTNALKCQPSVVIIDDLDKIAPQANDAHSKTGETLRQQLGRLYNSPTFVIAATHRLSDIDRRLRRGLLFCIEIELPVPDSQARAEILKVLTGIPRDVDDQTIKDVAARTHGFVGGDLQILLELTREAMYAQGGFRYESILFERPAMTAHIKDIFANNGDFLKQSLLSVRPTAMREIFVETPNVLWEDIGGLEDVKAKLRKSIVLPMKVPDMMARLGATPKKGILLYGPPGCSKTMIAKATARESGLNFIAIRGSELKSMYVGESERALREVFSKARAVKPSIVFFDEIDSIGASSVPGQINVGVDTVTTLLNEIDGFYSLEGVFILAATNKPENLDPALIRAGRLGSTIYVGLPDTAARREILRKQILTMPIGVIDENAIVEATEGFSGVEIVEICKEVRSDVVEAGEKYNLDSADLMVNQKHFDVAIGRAEKSVTADKIAHYKAWAASRH